MVCFVKQEVPPLPRRNKPFDSGLLNEQSGVVYAQLRKQSPRETPRSQNISKDGLPGNHPKKAQRSTTKLQNPISRYSPPDSDYPDLSLLETSKSRSLPLLDIASDREHFRLSAPPHTSARFSPNATRQANRYVPQSEITNPRSTQSNSHSLDYMDDSAVYHLAGRPGSPHTTSSDTRSTTSRQQNDSVYAEVSHEAAFAQSNTYELIAGDQDTAHLKANNTYEPLEDVRPKTGKVSNVFYILHFPNVVIHIG